MQACMIHHSAVGMQGKQSAFMIHHNACQGKGAASQTSLLNCGPLNLSSSEVTVIGVR